MVLFIGYGHLEPACRQAGSPANISVGINFLLQLIS